MDNASPVETDSESEEQQDCSVSDCSQKSFHSGNPSLNFTSCEYKEKKEEFFGFLIPTVIGLVFLFICFFFAYRAYNTEETTEEKNIEDINNMEVTINE